MPDTNARKNLLLICSDDIQVGTFGSLVRDDELCRRFTPQILSLDRYYYGGFSALWAQRVGDLPVHEMKGPASPSSDLRRMGLFAAWSTVVRFVLPDVEQCIGELKPDVLVTTNDNGFVERLFIRAAGRLGIPTVLVQEGIIAASSRASLKDRIKTAITRWLLRPVGLEFLGTTRYGCGKCDIIALYGNAAARVLARRGVAPDRLRIIGSLRNDRIIEARRQFKSQQAAPQLGIAPDAQLHLILSTNILTGLQDKAGHLLQLNEIRAIHRVILECDPNAQILVKLHPRDQMEDYSDLFELPNLKVLRDIDLYSAILLSHVVYCSFSGAAYEAAALERPVLATALEFQNDDWHLSAISESPLEIIRDPVKLRSNLLLLAHPGGYRQFLLSQSAAIAEVVFSHPEQTATSRFTGILREAGRFSRSQRPEKPAPRSVRTR